jgi:hypothetical protein
MRGILLSAVQFENPDKQKQPKSFAYISLVLCAVTIVLFGAPFELKAYAQVNIYGVISEVARAAAEQQRQQQQLEAERQARRAVIQEQRRREAEARTQERAERARRALEARAEDERRAAIQKAAAEAEQKRQAMARLVPAAKQLLQDASEFLKTNPTKALELVEQISSLNTALESTDPELLQGLMKSLVTALRAEPGYDAFESGRGEMKRAQTNAYLADLIKMAKQQREFIQYYVTNNPTSPQTRILLPHIKRLAAAVAAPELQTMRTLTTQIDLDIREGGLGDEFLKSKNLLTATTALAQDAASQQGMLRKTTKNAFLIDGDNDDFVLLYNSSSKSPHVVKNLRGEFDFDNGYATACLYQAGFDRSELYLLRRKLQSYKLKSSNIDIDQAECTRSDLLSYDVVAVERSAFLRLSSEQSLTLLSEIENERFRHLATISHNERDESRRAEDKARSQITDDLDHDARNGFGIIIVNQDIPSLCLVASQHLRGHKKWIDENVDRLSAETNLNLVREKNALNYAYEAIQREECGAIYASAPNLKELTGALKRESKEYSVASLWVDYEEIEALEQLVNKQEADELAQATRRKAAAEGERQIAALRRADELNKQENRQRELRNQYGKTASAAAAAITGEVKVAFDTKSEWQNTPAFKQFSKVVSTYQNLVQSRWELQSFNSEVSDYGTADFKGRSLQAAFVQVNARMRNRILGEYKDLCFIFGRINDTEFGVSRESIGITCSETNQIEYWKRGHEFKSSWIAE